ncbi:MAG: DNA repair protein RadA, partial [Defluviitaleaceae bacterium]|nr:DNA repair protein RadA [Defluviitaleaceae bacterium]
MPKTRTIFICGECGHEVGRWLGRCPGCKSYNTFEEAAAFEKKIGGNKSGASMVADNAAQTRQEPVHISKIKSLEDEKTPTGISELDRVLSGGIVAGSLILVGGEPGIGKSTLLLQICECMSVGIRGNVLYVSGEESLAQIKLRADRLGVSSDNLYLFAETNIGAINRAIESSKPAMVIIDSIQTMYIDEMSSAPGSMVQVRESTAYFMRLAKSRGISIVIVGHVTKEGAIAGPRILEHMVDAVLYFEGERQNSYRIIRAVKNRFGATNEIGVFEMCENGLVGIANPSEYMLNGRPLMASGSVVTCTVEGSRPILTEVQSLAAKTNFGNPRRVANGMDYNRMNMLLAMLEKRGGGFN